MYQAKVQFKWYVNRGERENQDPPNNGDAGDVSMRVYKKTFRNTTLNFSGFADHHVKFRLLPFPSSNTLVNIVQRTHCCSGSSSVLCSADGHRISLDMGRYSVWVCVVRDFCVETGLFTCVYRHLVTDAYIEWHLNYWRSSFCRMLRKQIGDFRSVVKLFN